MIKKSHIILFLTTAGIFPSPAWGQDDRTTDVRPSGQEVTAAPDSVKVTRLRELVVQGENAWIEGEKAVFLPSKRDRKLSNSVGSLLKRMNIPTLIVEGEKIRSISGKKVTVFINGVRAERIDFSTFWPKQAIRVEYMDFPKDPRFEGVECAVNFVMKTYQAGGVARVNAAQRIRNSGKYTVASKLEYRRMTFGVMANAAYSRDHLSSASGYESYDDIDYDGEHFAEVEKGFSERQTVRSDDAGASVNARYSGRKAVISHTASLKWKNNPGSGTDGTLSWDPRLFPDGSSSSRSKGHSLSPQLFGSYNFRLSTEWRVNARWSYAHSHNDASYLYSQDGLVPIVNSTEEDVNSMSAYASVSWRPSRRISTFAEVKSTMDWYETAYSGSADIYAIQRRGETYANLSLHWSPSETIKLTFKPGLTVAYWKSGDNPEDTHVTPRAVAKIQWSPSRKFNASADVSYFRNYPTSSSTADVTVRQTELVWASGNPFLKGADKWWVNAGHTWIPAGWLRISNSLWWNFSDNEVISVYRAAPAGMGGVVRTDINGAGMDSFSWDLSAYATLLDGRLSLSMQPTFQHYDAHGEFERSAGWFRMRGSASFSFGNFDLSTGYGGPEKYITGSGTRLFRTSDDWYLAMTYGNGDIYVNVAVEDIFHRRRTGREWMTAGNLSSFRIKSENGRYLRINLTYTLGFGKKVKRNINVSGPDDIKSGAIVM